MILAAVLFLIAGAYGWLLLDDWLRRRRARLDQADWKERHQECESQAIRERVRTVAASIEVMNARADASLRIARSLDDPDEPWKSGL